MLLTLLAAVALSSQDAKTAVLTPTDDVWVYSHSNDNQDPFLRAWGSEGKSVAPNAGELENFGYSYLRFELPEGVGTLTGATLTLTHKEKPAFTSEMVHQYPLEVRLLNGDFNEKTWIYDRAAQVFPIAGVEGLLGKSADFQVPASGTFKITIDLTKHLELLEKSRGKNRVFTLALTSVMSAADLGQGCIYKVFSKDAENEKNRPELKISYK